VGQQKILECVLCSKRYSIQDVKSGNYFPSTGVCLGCYGQAQVGNKKLWCFGTFQANAIECKTECPDKRICREFTNRS
jgi:hypothetical protein